LGKGEAEIIKRGAQFARNICQERLHEALSFDAIADFLNLRDPQPTS
jgi:hypothetical protein